MISENNKYELTDQELERVAGGNLDSGWISVHCESCNEDSIIADPTSHNLEYEECPKCHTRGSLRFL